MLSAQCGKVLGLLHPLFRSMFLISVLNDARTTGDGLTHGRQQARAVEVLRVGDGVESGKTRFIGHFLTTEIGRRSMPACMRALKLKSNLSWSARSAWKNKGSVLFLVLGALKMGWAYRRTSN